MGSKYQQLFIGVLIILIGTLILIYNLGILYLDDQFVWGIAFIVLGAVFLGFYYRKSLPGNVRSFGILFLIIGIFLILDSLLEFPQDLLGALFLWLIAAAFISIFVRHSHRWWAIIPGGIFITLGFIVVIDTFHLLAGDLLWFVFLLGTSLTFWFLFLIKDDKNRLHWAIYPAIGMTLFSFFTLSLVTESLFGDILFPLSVIGTGILLLGRALWQKQPPVSNEAVEETSRQ